MIARREEICLAAQIGLTELYNRIDDGAYADLGLLHRQLDAAVAEAYGWPAGIAHDDDAIVQLLLDRNREIAASSRQYDPFESSIVPPQFPLT